jgi:pyruvate/2-oxoglutarate dehydrogenase complex dihydrolipoamide acyltransferase (E2) component
MSQIIEATVPDIGDYHDIPVIDLCVAVGDTVKVDDALVTLESDKATMDVPSSIAGVVREVKVKLGDRVSAGSVVALIEAAGAVEEASPAASIAAPPGVAAATAPQAAAAMRPAPISNARCWSSVPARVAIRRRFAALISA